MKFASTIAGAVLLAGPLLLLPGAGGCTTRPVGPYTPLAESDRHTTRAELLTKEAADLVEKDPERAERLLREALTADLYHGPAHNNLGVLFLKQARLYEAANEFEWAKKLLPGHPDPRFNLAFTLESAGRVDEALTMYASALEVYPDHLASLQAITKLQIRSGRTDGHTDERLREIALRGETDAWKTWARKQLARAP